MKDSPPEVHVSSVSSDPSEAVEDGVILKTSYRKVDLRLLTFYATVAMLMKIESHNITNAAIMNIEQGTDIKHQLGGLSSEQWALILSVYDYPHLIFEPISTLLLKRFAPRTWMSRIMLSWGIISMCHAAAQDFGGLLACRCLLGLAEAGFHSGVLFHLSFWFPTERMPMRIAILVAFAQLAGAASGLLAFAISYLNGKSGLAGWRYLFILEGAPAVICGMFAIFFLPNYPEDVKFLTEQERRAVLRNLPKTQPSSGDKTWSWQQMKGFLKDVTTYTFLGIWISHSIGAKGVMTVLPTVIYQLGRYSSTSSQLMTMPPYIIGSIVLLCIAYFIQRKKLKSWTVALCMEAMACACYIVLVVVEQPLAKYIMLILAAVCQLTVFPILWPERIRAAEGTTGAGLAIGITSTSSDLHGIIGPQIYQDSFGPSYRISFSVSIGLICFSLASIAVTWAILCRRAKNKSKDQERNESEVEIKAGDS